MANLNLNKVILAGRLTADPELKTTASGVCVTSFTVAVNRRRAKPEEEQKVDFISVTAWRQTAEFITRFFRKGASICLAGSLQVRSWTDPAGAKRYATEVVADEAMFVDSKSDEVPGAVSGGADGTGAKKTGATPAQKSYPQQKISENKNIAPSFDAITDDEDMPF